MSSLFISFDIQSLNLNIYDPVSDLPLADPSPIATCIWFSGNIANRKELVKKIGCEPSVSTEDLLVSLYQKFGKKSPELIEGSFAWVIWDHFLQQLVVVRDSLGLIGLFYRWKGTTIKIADRIDRLLEGESYSYQSINLLSIAAHLQYSYLLPGQTFYNEIQAVQAGEIIIINRDGAKGEKYWDLHKLPTLIYPSDQEYFEAFRELLFKIVSEYVSDETVGVTLSGGMDSSSIASAVRTTSPSTQILAVSYITPELPEANEHEYVEKNLRFLNIPVYYVRGDQLWPLKDEGIRTNRESPYYLFYTALWDGLFKTASEQGLKFLFTGSAGDNLFGAQVFPYWDLLLTFQLTALFNEFRELHQRTQKSWPRLIRQFLLSSLKYGLFLKKENFFPPPGPFLQKGMVKVYGEYQRRAWAQTELPFLPGRQRRVREMRLQWTSLVDEHLAYQASDYGLQLLMPYQDRRMVELAARLPTWVTYKQGYQKYIQRGAMKGYLPKDVLEYRGKITPSAIFDYGLITREQEKVRQMITHMRSDAMGFVYEKVIQENYEAYLKGGNLDASFWYTLTLEDWLRRYF